MPGPGSSACPKPSKGTAKRARAKLRRADGAVAKRVREKVETRDGYCRLAVVLEGTSRDVLFDLFGPCSGPSEWAHLVRRSATRGMAPEARHTSRDSVKFCHGHHQGRRGHERHWFDIEYVTARGADGPLRFVVRRDRRAYIEDAGRFVV